LQVKFAMARSFLLLCALARAALGFAPPLAGRAAVRLCAEAAESEVAESVEFELSGNVRTSFFANVCRRELLFNRGMAGTMREGRKRAHRRKHRPGPRRRLHSRAEGAGPTLKRRLGHVRGHRRRRCVHRGASVRGGAYM
jgi:hypothetical protein